MTGVLIRRHTNTYREDGHVTMEAGVELLQQAVMNHPKLPENHQKLARVEEASPPTQDFRDSTVLPPS